MNELVINGVLVTVLIAVIGGAIKITRTLAADNAELKKQLVDQAREHTGEIARMEREHNDHLDKLRREFGEVANALRVKIHDFETWSRDEFVRKGSFDVVVSRMERGMESLGQRIEGRLDKMTDRIEKLPAAAS